MSRPILEVRGLTKRYPGFALEDVSLSVGAGRVMGFIGRNGAGKTTTLKAVLRFIRPDGGEVRFFGEDFRGREHEVMRRVSFSMGEVAFYPRRRLRTITDVYRRFFPLWDERVYRDCLERFELVEDKKVEALSAGMRVKYGIALALSRRAELLLLDEPTSGLDPLSRDDLLRELRELVDDTGVGLLFSTHQMGDLEQIADDVTYLSRGRVRASGILEDFAAHYRMVSGPAETVPSGLGSVLIGASRSQGRVTGLVEASRLGEAAVAGIRGLEVTPASLNDIIVHLERQEKQS